MLDFAFAFKFNIHKSSIPLGIADDDYRRLWAVYGVDSETMLQEAVKIEAANTEAAAALLQSAGILAEELNPGRDVKIAFLGDSITSDRQSYMNIIRRALAGNDHIAIADFAVSGYKSGDLLTMLFPDVIGTHADIVSIMIGTNDMRRTNDPYREFHTGIGEYEKNLRYVVQKLTGEGNRVILSTIPPFSLAKITATFDGYNILYTESDRNAFNERVRGVARDCGAVLNDMDEAYSRYPVDELVLADGLHLSDPGQRLLAEGLLPIIARIILQELTGK